MIVGLLLVAAGAVPELDLESTAAEVHRAVIRSDMELLSSVRASLKDALDDAGDVDAAALRFTFAYVSWRRAAGEERGSKPYKELLKDAEKELKELIKNNPEDGEAQALYGTVNGWLITGMWSGMRRGPRADKAYQAGRAAAPENPRVAMHQGVSRLFRPGMFGGGLDKAEAELSEALELFDQESRDKPWPNGGHAEIRAWMGQVMFRKRELERAREFYERALELEPEYRWVRETLVPELEAAEAELQH